MIRNRGPSIKVRASNHLGPGYIISKNDIFPALPLSQNDNSPKVQEGGGAEEMNLKMPGILTYLNT